MEIIPTNRPSRTTATRRTAWVRNRVKAPCRSASASMVTTGELITESTRASGDSLAAMPRRTRSRSVTMPTRSSPSTTASAPTAATSMILAAWVMVRSGAMPTPERRTPSIVLMVNSSLDGVGLSPTASGSA